MDPVVHFIRSGYYSVCEMPVAQEHGAITCPRCGRPGEVLTPDELKERLAALGYVIHEDGDSFTVAGQPLHQLPSGESVPQSIVTAVRTVAKAVKHHKTRRRKKDQP